MWSIFYPLFFLNKKKTTAPLRDFSSIRYDNEHACDAICCGRIRINNSECVRFYNGSRVQYSCIYNDKHSRNQRIHHHYKKRSKRLYWKIQIKSMNKNRTYKLELLGEADLKNANIFREYLGARLKERFVVQWTGKWWKEKRFGPMGKVEVDHTRGSFTYDFLFPTLRVLPTDRSKHPQTPIITRKYHRRV